MALQLHTDQATAAGLRKDNQDAIRVVTPAPRLAASKGHLVALADGVSQCRDGGLAARATLQALALDYYSTPETWSVTQGLERLLVAHNRWLRANGGGQPLLTTLSCMVLRGCRYTMAHIGDCRVYLWRAGRLQKISNEHVWEQPGMQHVLKRAMGLDEHPLIDYVEGDLQVGDRFLLLSDGVWAHLSDEAISSLLAAQDNKVEGLCQQMIDQALGNGSQDNLSALLLHVDALPQASLEDSLQPAEERAVPPRLKPQQPFEGWTICRELAESRQSLVYRVKDSLGHPWLLKTLPPSRQHDLAACRELLQEEWFLRRVAGRGIPELHPMPERRHHYYVMREYPGMNLAQHKGAHGLWSLAQFQQLAPQLLRGVGWLHRRNLVHRDIKPDNLHLGDDGQLRLLDFGLAFCPGLSTWHAGSPVGTPSYIAPEIFAGSEPSPAQDLYAAGVSLYFLLTGQYPYGEIEAFQRPRFNQAVPPSRYRPDLPAWLDDCLLKAVAIDPAQRYETAEEWQLALEQGDRLPPAWQPLIEREPLLVWRSVALIALAFNLLFVVLLLH
ncbi:MAG: protein kinase [Gammaproteobacteria bacterium HGW-Gammaproteobacteria-6]|nr:MAG: protein kinase [Gammaproteobacteria bacterium HGW-Gammaproteobacteria-6]